MKTIYMKIEDMKTIGMKIEDMKTICMKIEDMINTKIFATICLCCDLYI